MFCISKKTQQNDNDLLKYKTKKYGQVFTPHHIVCMILDNLGFYGPSILNKKIIEPSFGEGVFLLEVVKRIIEVCISLNFKKKDIKNYIEESVYGIEIDTILFNKAIKDLNSLVKTYEIENIQWNLFNKNALDCELLYGKFDFVIGNPPYVRVHNMDLDTRNLIKNYKFSNGTSDLYIIFFELGLKLLNPNGKLGYITPNSYMKNSSQSSFRKYLLENNLVEKIIDFKSSNVFDVSTYTAITILNKANHLTSIDYSEHNNAEQLYETKIDIDNLLSKENIYNAWNFNTFENNKLLSIINSREFKLSNICNVQYGITTNRDSIYICNNPTPLDCNYTLFNGYKIESNILKPIVKCSTYKGNEIVSKVIFPYRYNLNKLTYEVIPEQELIQIYPLAYKYFKDHKTDLLERDMDKNATTWYQFGRSQGLNCVNNNKIIVNHIVDKNKDSIDTYFLDKDIVVYSGIYLTAKDSFSLFKINQVIISEEFCVYSKLVGKDMSGGFKSITSKHIKNFGLDELDLSKFT